MNQLNHLFYQTVASSFNETRARPWSGWEKLLPSIENLSAKPTKVLDLGCGNGRFGAFLHDHDLKIHYTGIDINPYLLERAADLMHQKGIDHQLQEGDLINGYMPEQDYDLITLFGVMHHIPAFDQRRSIMQQLAGKLTPHGLLMITFWLFYEDHKLRERIIPWSDPRVPEAYHNLDLEAHDFLLEWRRDKPALRYCHYIDLAEMEKLLEGLKIVTTFEADGHNRYVIICNQKL